MCSGTENNCQQMESTARGLTPPSHTVAFLPRNGQFDATFRSVPLVKESPAPIGSTFKSLTNSLLFFRKL